MGAKGSRALVSKYKKKKKTGCIVRVKKDQRRLKEARSSSAEMSVCQRVCERVILLTETHQTTCNK